MQLFLEKSNAKRGFCVFLSFDLSIFTLNVYFL